MTGLVRWTRCAASIMEEAEFIARVRFRMLEMPGDRDAHPMTLLGLVIPASVVVATTCLRLLRRMRR